MRKMRKMRNCAQLIFVARKMRKFAPTRKPVALETLVLTQWISKDERIRRTDRVYRSDYADWNRVGARGPLAHFGIGSYSCVELPGGATVTRSMTWPVSGRSVGLQMTYFQSPLSLSLRILLPSTGAHDHDHSLPLPVASCVPETAGRVEKIERWLTYHFSRTFTIVLVILINLYIKYILCCVVITGFSIVLNWALLDGLIDNIVYKRYFFFKICKFLKEILSFYILYIEI